MCRFWWGREERGGGRYSMRRDVDCTRAPRSLGLIQELYKAPTWDFLCYLVHSSVDIQTHHASHVRPNRQSLEPPSDIPAFGDPRMSYCHFTPLRPLALINPHV